MEFYKNNAYPEIFLHDCECKINYNSERQVLQLVFDVGFAIKDDGNGNIERKSGSIQISNLPIEEITIKTYRFHNLLGHFRMIGKYCELSDFDNFFKDYCFQIIEEYYAYETLLLRGIPYPYNSKQKFDEIQIEIHHGKSPIEYYFV